MNIAVAASVMAALLAVGSVLYTAIIVRQGRKDLDAYLLEKEFPSDPIDTPEYFYGKKVL